MQHVLMAGVWRANFFLVRQPIGQTVVTRVADLSVLTSILGWNTKEIQYKTIFNNDYYRQKYTYPLYTIQNDKKYGIHIMIKQGILKFVQQRSLFIPLYGF